MLTNLTFKKLPDSTTEHIQNSYQYLELSKHKITNLLELANFEILQTYKIYITVYFF